MFSRNNRPRLRGPSSASDSGRPTSLPTPPPTLLVSLALWRRKLGLLFLLNVRFSHFHFGRSLKIDSTAGGDFPCGQVHFVAISISSSVRDSNPARLESLHWVFGSLLRPLTSMRGRDFACSARWSCLTLQISAYGKKKQTPNPHQFQWQGIEPFPISRTFKRCCGHPQACVAGVLPAALSGLVFLSNFRPTVKATYPSSPSRSAPWYRTLRAF